MQCGWQLAIAPTLFLNYYLEQFYERELQANSAIQLFKVIPEPVTYLILVVYDYQYLEVGWVWLTPVVCYPMLYEIPHGATK